MTIYEPKDFYQQWNPEWMEFNRKVDKLKEMRRKVAHDNQKKEEEGIPTSQDLARWLNR